MEAKVAKCDCVLEVHDARVSFIFNFLQISMVIGD